MSIRKICDMCGVEEGKITQKLLDISIEGGSLIDGSWQTFNRGHLCELCLEIVQDYAKLPPYEGAST